MSTTSDRPGPVVLKAFGLTDPGRVRQNNEDAFLIAALEHAAEGATPVSEVAFDASSSAVLLAVSDGMGGADAGEVASALVVRSLRDAMLTAQGDWNEATRRAVESANRAVYDAAGEPGKAGMGATVTVVCVHKDQAHIAEVGDSRAYILRDGRLRQVTRDQSFVQFLVESGALKPEEVEAYPLKNVVLQAMGQHPDVQVALGRLELRRGDRLLLCSDGLSGMVKPDEMRSSLEHATSLDAACRALIALANERGGADNITVVLAEATGEGLQPPRVEETLTQTFQVLAEYKLINNQVDDPMEDPSVEDSDKLFVAGTQAVVSPAAPPPRGMSRQKMIAVAVALGLAVAAVVLALVRA